MSKDSSERCPVCGMQVDGEQRYTQAYQKMWFHFCSEQCRETFRQRPELYSGKRAREHGAVIKCRRLRLAAPPVPAVVETTLRELMGVTALRFDGATLTLRYDLLQVTLAQIERALAAAGVALDDGLWQRLSRGWIHHTEENELNNLAAPSAACCNRPPARR